jgi:hypothetical protein
LLQLQNARQAERRSGNGEMNGAAESEIERQQDPDCFTSNTVPSNILMLPQHVSGFWSSVVSAAIRAVSASICVSSLSVVPPFCPSAFPAPAESF